MRRKLRRSLLTGRIIDETASLILGRLPGARSVDRRRPFVLGIAGAQGSGKSTLARALVSRLAFAGEGSAAISIDDFYFGRAERRRIASAKSPLLVTRGPPGTHDVSLAIETFASLRRGASASVPVFDKGLDEPHTERLRLPAGLDVIVFEGWCLGAKPQAEGALREPINMLEKMFDADGAWRRTVNDALAGAYQALFDEIDFLVYLRPPSFDVVLGWRAEQEAAIAAAPGAMTVDELSFFIQHFERLTRWMMDELPRRADITLQLDARRRVLNADAGRR